MPALNEDEALIYVNRLSLLGWASKKCKLLGQNSCRAFEVMLHLLESAEES